MKEELANQRSDYSAGRLERKDVNTDPFAQFENWMQTALKNVTQEPTAFSLATADAQGTPSVRIVLLKGAAQNGFTFFTNYGSRKGQEIAQNPQASMLFFWPELQRQIRITGPLTKVPRAESQEYFDSRPFASRIGALASLQSQTLSSREILEQDVSNLQQKYQDDQSVPLPDHWGGYRIIALEYEYWQGRVSRLHDRWFFRRDSINSQEWNLERLYP